MFVFLVIKVNKFNGMKNVVFCGLVVYTKLPL